MSRFTPIRTFTNLMSLVIPPSLQEITHSLIDMKSFQLGFAVSPKIAVSMRLAPFYRPKQPVFILIVIPTLRKLKYERFLPKVISRTLLCTCVRTHPTSLLYHICLWHIHGIKWPILQLTDNYTLQQRIYEKFRVGSCSGNIVRTFVH